MSDGGLPIDDNGRDDGMLAAEYVLGILDADARRATEARLASDPALATEVEAWEVRLTPLAALVAETPPSAVVWSRIEAALGAGVPGPRLSLVSESPLRSRPPIWRSAAWAAGGAIAASLLWGLVLVGVRTPESGRDVGPVLVASIAPQGGRPWWVATIDPIHRSIHVTPAAAGLADRRARELWLIPADGRPRALGVFPADQAASMPMPEALLRDAAPRTTVAVSLEPAGGSPTGKPTGPVIATGTLSEA